MSTLYLNQHGTVITKCGGKIIIKTRDGQQRSIPSSYAECLVVMANVQVSYAVIMEVLGNGGSIVYLSRDGRIAGELGTRLGRPRNLVRQLSCYLDDAQRQHLASIFVRKKLRGERNLLRIKNKSSKSDLVQAAIGKLTSLIKAAEPGKTVEALMGVEGIAAKTYFDVFPVLLSGSGFEWTGRKKRPAPDPVNAMLGFGYALLEKDVRRIISAAGLSESIGFLHGLDYRKDSLVYDIMEIFRAGVIDRFVFRCIGLKIIAPEDFSLLDGKCLFSEEAKKLFVAEYENFVADETASDEPSVFRQMEMEVNNVLKELRELTMDNDDLE